MIYTTLNKIRAHSPCEDGWRKLLKHLRKTEADDEPLPLVTVLDSNGLDDTLWCLCTVQEHNKLWRLYAVWCARQVQHLMIDQRSIDALDVAECHANGAATDKELAAARAAAWDAAWDADWSAAMDAARAAAWSAAMDAARAAAGSAARAAARAAAWDAARAAARAAAMDADWSAAMDAARAAARATQSVRLREILTTTPECQVEPK